MLQIVNKVILIIVVASLLLFFFVLTTITSSSTHHLFCLNVGDDTWTAISYHTGPGNARVSNQYGTGDVPGEDIMLLP